MLYKPNFCCNCGEKIERIEWTVLTSRRFCPTCAVEHRRYDHMPRVVVAVGSLALMFGLGSLWAGSVTETGKVASKPVGIRSSVPPTDVTKAAIAEPVQQSQQPETQSGLPEPATAESKDRQTAAYFCGALTKKGTPCSRKVKTKGTRCFQHEGRPEAPASQ